MKCWELRWLLAPLPFSRSLAALSALPPLIQGEQLMALVPLSCQWSRARLCACSVGFFFFFTGKRLAEWSLPPSPPCSPLPSLVSLRLGKEKALVHRRGATGEAARQEGELRESLTGFCCVVVVVVLASQKDRPPPSSSSPSSSSSERAVIRPSPSLH